MNGQSKTKFKIKYTFNVMVNNIGDQYEDECWMFECDCHRDVDVDLIRIEMILFRLV